MASNPLMKQICKFGRLLILHRKAAHCQRGSLVPFPSRYSESASVHHKLWDNVVWSEDQMREAQKKVAANSSEFMNPELRDKLENEAGSQWDGFYSQHQNRFFKDRHWLFTEFPELAATSPSSIPTQQDGLPPKVDQIAPGTAATFQNSPEGISPEDLSRMSRSSEQTIQLEDETNLSSQTQQSKTNIASKVDGLLVEDECEETTVPCRTTIAVGESQFPGSSRTITVPALASEDQTLMRTPEEGATQDMGKSPKEKSHGEVSVEEESSSASTNPLEDSDSGRFPGWNSCTRILEVGCGVGNTIFPILQTNIDPGLFVYGCDFSSVAVDIVKQHREYNLQRCHAFVYDVTDESAALPFPEGSLDIIILIFVLSAIHPEKMQKSVNRLARHLKPGGLILLRDYGRYDLAQLRFKKGRCLSDHFYARGDGTLVYFFTQDELRTLFTGAGLVEEQNIVDHRLQVNRGRQLTMYRVWMQCKYRKPMQADGQTDEGEA